MSGASPGCVARPLVLHYVTFAEAQRDLSAAGFEPDIDVYSPAGERVSSAGETDDAPWLHLLARKPGADSP